MPVLNLRRVNGVTLLKSRLDPSLQVQIQA
jgi:hypothetical protein